MNRFKEEKIIIGVLTCPKNRNQAIGIRDTWLKLIPAHVQVLFVFGRPGRPSSLEGDQLYLDCKEAYEHLPQKAHLFFKYCEDNLDFDHILKIDDDTYVDVAKFLSFDNEGSDYTGLFLGMGDDESVTRTWHFGKCTDKSYEVPYEGPFICEWARGGGYLVSRNAVRILIEKTATSYSRHIFEDMMVGEALTLDERIKTLNVHYVQMGILNPISPPNMRYIHQLIMNQKN